VSAPAPLAATLRPLPATPDPVLDAAVVDVYAAAFAGPPYDEGAAAAPRFAPRWAAHRPTPGWRGFGAWVGDRLVGFAYGHAAVAGAPWVDALFAHLAPTTRAKWAADAFLVCELAVAPAHRGLGLGAALHDALIAEAPHATALLTTLDDRENVGAKLYARRGWRRVSAPYVVAGYPHRYVVLGVRLDRCG
jgi:GNAT superfamily N-acetyltransferase